MKKLVLYIHGKGGSAAEAEHYRPLFAGREVIGLDYRAQTPWAAKEEFPRLFDSVAGQGDSVLVVANSIGAYFTMCALAEKPIERALFISPIVDMERLISDMMRWANVTEETLRDRKEIRPPSARPCLGTTSRMPARTHSRGRPRPISCTGQMIP